MAIDRGASGVTRTGQTSETYRIFATGICSSFPLPELPVAAGSESRITVKKVKNGQIDLAGFVSCHEWLTEAGLPICQSARRGDHYLLSFPGRASFHISASGEISCLPGPGGGDEDVRQLLLSQVIPRLLGHTGEYLLHAGGCM